MAKAKPTPDYSDYQDTAMSVGDNLMQALILCADKHETLVEEVENLTAELARKRAALVEIAEKELPQMLDGIMGSILLTDGRAIEIREKLRASIAGEKGPPAIAWLDKHGHSAIVKRQFIIEFGKDDDKWADKFERDLAQRRKPLMVKRKKSVHPQTLEAFVREQFNEGVDLPQDIFGIWRQRTAKVTR